MFGKKSATKENILEKITEYDIFKYYVSNFKNIGVAFKSELKKDTRPSCGIFVSNNKLYYKDFRDSQICDCFNYVMCKYHINYYQALDLINRDFQLNLMPNTSVDLSSIVQKEIKLYSKDYLLNTTVEKEIKVQVRNWNTTLDKKFWKERFDISVKDLTPYEVYPLKYIWIFGMNGWNGFPAASVSYGFYCGKNAHGKDAWKIYQPYEYIKWLGNLTVDCVHGYKQLPENGDLLIITKSLKDVIVLRKLGYHAVAPGAEVWTIPENIMNELKLRFKRIVVLYDNDETGKSASQKICNLYNLENPVFLPEDRAKDSSDYAEAFGYKALDNQIKILLNVESRDTQVAKLL